MGGSKRIIVNGETKIVTIKEFENFLVGDKGNTIIRDEDVKASIKNILNDKKKWEIYYEGFAEQYYKTWCAIHHKVLNLSARWREADRIFNEQELWRARNDGWEKEDEALFWRNRDFNENLALFNASKIIKNRSEQSRIFYDRAFKEIYHDFRTFEFTKEGKSYNFDDFRRLIYLELEETPSQDVELVEETLAALQTGYNIRIRKENEERLVRIRKENDERKKKEREEIEWDKQEIKPLGKLLLYKELLREFPPMISSYNEAEKFAWYFFKEYQVNRVSITPTFFLKLGLEFGLLEWVKQYKNKLLPYTLKENIVRGMFKDKVTMETALNNLIAYIQKYEVRNKAKSVLGVWKSAKKLKF